ncbi:DUF2726 domain-containing protein [Janthinobacterium sp. BJB304]|uniref:DUF2726 domain-containing protein n=1 Tax=Janthinobacterium sp. BJB304 TaxID=1572871 RepID=UPI000C0D2D30|nr:DUF2726 domain-containing protein [Janthinobacterium sp. BJB304]PHV38946.1 hypothetical protein CSQ95_11825 [Janthinobacterium sp. BJB304]
MNIFIFFVSLALAALVAQKLFTPEMFRHLFPQTPGPLQIKRKQILTNREQQMFALLTAALPECIVLTQVAFSALITADGWQTRNRFNRKVVDFVLCSNHMNVVAVIELDDRSHIGREDNDRERDAMLKQAGYHTIRYPSIPTTEKVRRDIEYLLLNMHTF